MKITIGCSFRLAQREAAKGKRVLLLCFTEALAAFLSGCLRKSNVEVGAVKQFAMQLLGEISPGKPLSRTVDYWKEVTLRAAVDGLPSEEKRWDTVILDEGQDFSGDDFEFAGECVRPQGKLWIFADQGQAFWPDRLLDSEMVRGFPKCKLKKPYRCHPAIQHLDDCYSGHCEPDQKLLQKGLKEGAIGIVTSSEKRLLKQIEKEIKRLLSGGLKPGDIAVLSLRGRGSEEGITHRREIGGHPIVRHPEHPDRSGRSPLVRHPLPRHLCSQRGRRDHPQVLRQQPGRTYGARAVAPCSARPTHAGCKGRRGST